MFFIGIDQSYTSTGFVVLNEDKSIESAKILTSSKEDDIFKRAWELSEEISKEITKFSPCKISIEGLAFSMTGNATRDLAGLQFSIITKIKFNLGKEIKIVSPPALKKFASGNGKATKNEMIESLPIDILEHFTKTLKIKKSKGLTDLTDAYFLAKILMENSNNE